MLQAVPRKKKNQTKQTSKPTQFKEKAWEKKFYQNKNTPDLGKQQQQKNCLFPVGVFVVDL